MARTKRKDRAETLNIVSLLFLKNYHECCLHEKEDLGKNETSLDVKEEDVVD